jgi:hypothetical protein
MLAEDRTKSTLSLKGFPDEDHWPLLGRGSQLNECLSFLVPDTTRASSRLLRIAGESGVGKSFFAKELICRFAARAPSSIAVYVSTEESEFESSHIEKKLAALVSNPAVPTRKNPQHVPRGADSAQYRRPLTRTIRFIGHLYEGVRELAALIPFVGKGVKAALPLTLPTSRERTLVAAGRIWEFLTETAQRRPVLVAIDDVQFLPESVILELSTVLAAADTGVRLVVIERLVNGVSHAKQVNCFGDNFLSIQLGVLSSDETRALVRSVAARIDNADELAMALFRSSMGNPKQLWLQLRILGAKSPTKSTENMIGDYEETILGLPDLDRLTLQLITLLMGGLKVDDVVRILEWIVHPTAENEIRRTIFDLAVLGMLIVNSASNNRVRTEHELVRTSVRRTTTEQEALELRHQVISALNERLEHGIEDDEYERLVDRLMGLLGPEDVRSRHDLLAHLIALIDRQHTKEQFHYLCALYGTPSCSGALPLLPSHSALAFLDAFQKTSQFHKGLAAIEIMRGHGRVSDRTLSVFGAKYLVQNVQYEDAEALLNQISPGSDKDLILLNILLNLCRDDDARRLVGALPSRDDELDELQCVMLRNAAHLHDLSSARTMLDRARRGFKSRGLSFGEATTLNNLGVLELWGGRRHDARRSLTAARTQLQILNSNETYQPLNNLSVLCALEGDLGSAKRLLEEARAAVSPWLRMDEIMIRLNRLVLNLMDGSTSVGEAAATMNGLLSRSLQTKDLRFRDVVAWFTRQLEIAHFGDSMIDEPPDFEARFHPKSQCGLEVFFELSLERRTVPAVLQLSPHWRY